MNDAVEQEMTRLGVSAQFANSSQLALRIAQLENALGTRFPMEYQYFLQKYGDIRIDAWFDCKTLPGTYIARLYGLRFTGEDGPNEVHQFDELSIAPVGITIACDDFGNLIVMFLDGALNGKIYFYVHDGFADFRDDPNWQSSGLSWKDLSSFDESEDKPDAFQNLHFAADSFVAFLQKLSKLND